MSGPTFMSGEEVDLRTVEEDDLDVFARARSDPALQTRRAIDSPGNRDSLEEFFEETVSSDDAFWFVITDDAEEVVGSAAFPEVDESAGVAELDVWTLSEFRADGYGSEGLSLLLRYGFEELRLHRVYADCVQSNDTARERLEGAGFTEEGRFREAAFRDGTHVDVVRYGLLQREWGDA